MSQKRHIFVQYKCILILPSTIISNYDIRKPCEWRVKREILKQWKYLQKNHGVYLISAQLGRSLMTGWRKKSWNPERVPTVVTHFFVLRNFHFYTFYMHFFIFSLYNTSIFLVSSNLVTVFHLGMWFLGRENLVP